MAVNEIHVWVNDWLTNTFGPLDLHRKHVLLLWVISIFVGLSVFEIVREQIRLWWKRRK